MGQSVLLQGFCPAGAQKCRGAIISSQQVPLTYKVLMDSQVRQAYVDHFKISSENYATLEQPNNLQTSELINCNPDSLPNTFLFTNLNDTGVDSTCNSPQLSVEPYQRPHHNCGHRKG